MALLSFFFLDLEKWFQTSSYCFLPSLENSDHTILLKHWHLDELNCLPVLQQEKKRRRIHQLHYWIWVHLYRKNAHLIEWKQYESKTPLQWHITPVFKQLSVQDSFYKSKREINPMQLLKQSFWNKKYQTSMSFLRSLRLLPIVDTAQIKIQTHQQSTTSSVV